MLERIMKDKLKFATIMVSIIVFIVGIIITIINTEDTYALTYEDYDCSLGGGIPVYGKISDNVYGYYCSIKTVEVATMGFSVGTSLEDDSVCESYLNKMGYSHVTSGSGYYCTYVANLKENTISFYSNKPYDELEEDMDGNKSDFIFSEEVSYGSVYVISSSASPSRDGYKFLGWSLDKNATEAVFVVGDQISVLEDIKLYAIWSVKNYVVTYNGNGGLYEGSDIYRDLQRPVYGVDYIVYDNDDFFIREGYTFTGWKDQYGNIWNSGYVNWQYDEDITLYAQWVLNDTSSDDTEEPGIENPDTKIEYTVNYNANGGVGTTQSSLHTYGESKKLTANGFLKTGYTFVGWATSSNGSVVYSDKDEVTNLSSTNGSIVTLYAVWKANTYNIDYKLHGGVISGNPTSGIYGEDVTIKNPTKEITIVGNDNKTGATIGDNVTMEQKFIGWTSSTIDVNSAYYDDTAWIDGNTKVTSMIFKNLTTTDGDTVTLVANWREIDVTLPTVTKDDYVCTWNTKTDGSGTSYKSGEVVKGFTNSVSSVNLYAICESGSKIDEELNNGPQTGSAFIYAVWIIGSGALGYSVYYFMKKRSEM